MRAEQLHGPYMFPPYIVPSSPYRVDLLRFPMLHQHESRAVGAKDEALSHQIFQSKAVTRPQHARVLQSQLMLVHDQLRLPRSPCVYESLRFEGTAGK
eukprot:1158122-Pelagomonas_calceolata.AAC.25